MEKAAEDNSRKASATRKRGHQFTDGHAFSEHVLLFPLHLVDDDCFLASLVAEYCSAGGFSITSTASGEEGINLDRQQCFLLFILDATLLKRLRNSPDTAVLMLMTRDSTMGSIHGLESGAEDYLTERCRPEELVARIQSILHRVYPREGASRCTVGDLTVDGLGRSVTLSNRRLHLTGAEFMLLSLLIANPGDPLSREELIPRIFGREPTSQDRSIDNLVNNLRRKLGKYPDGMERIKSVRNVGYYYALRNKEPDAS